MIEVINEAIHEITADPVLFIVEIVQFSIIAGILAYALPRYFGKMLKERRQRIIKELERAKSAEEEHRKAESVAKELIIKAKKEAKDLLEPTKDNSSKEFDEAKIQIKEESENIINQANKSIETEMEKVKADVNDKLIKLVTVTTRRFIKESLTENERRTLTKKMIMDGLKDIDNISIS